MPTVTRLSSSRRAFLATAALALCPSRPAAWAAGTEPFDKLMTDFLAEHKVPGAALAVARHGKLVHSAGFGFADVEKKEPMRPASLFRIASLSKPITAVAVLQLVERGKLSLDDKVLDRMKLKPHLAGGAKADARWKDVTVRHCLQHTGGWDRTVSYDPIASPWYIAKEMGIQPPITPEIVVRYMMGQPLDFAPGERHAYSNLGYLVLGRIVEAVTGQKYEAHVQKEVFAPLGVTTARLGRFENRMKGEVKYYDAKKGSGRSLYPPRVGETVLTVYGAMNLEAYEAHGGWVASAPDLAAFAAVFDDPAKCPILGKKMIEEMWARPAGAAGTDAKGKPRDSYYGCGWQVRPVGTAGKANHWHTGYIPGSEAILVRRWDGLSWAVLFNANDNPDGKALAGLIDGRVHGAADAVTAWPTGS